MPCCGAFEENISAWFISLSALSLPGLPAASIVKYIKLSFPEVPALYVAHVSPEQEFSYTVLHQDLYKLSYNKNRRKTRTCVHPLPQLARYLSYQNFYVDHVKKKKKLKTLVAAVCQFSANFLSTILSGKWLFVWTIF